MADGSVTESVKSALSTVASGAKELFSRGKEAVSSKAVSSASTCDLVDALGAKIADDMYEDVRARKFDAAQDKIQLLGEIQGISDKLKCS